MTENDIRAPDFQVVEMTNSGPIYHEKSDVVNTYKGFVGGDTLQWTRAFISDFKFGMLIFYNNEYYSIEPLFKYLSGHQADDKYLVFKQKDLISEGICGTKSENNLADNSGNSLNPTEVLKARILELATDVDYEFFDKFRNNGGGTHLENVNATIEEIINQVDQLFIPLNMAVSLVESHVWTTTTDPYDMNSGPPNSETHINLWDQFKQEWSINSCRRRDAAVLFSDQNFGHYGYVKYLGQGSICMNEYTCGPNFYKQSCAIVRGVTPSLDMARLARTTAHEIGHIFGLGHPCNQCGIMNSDCMMDPCSTAPLGFSDETIIKLSNFLDGVKDECGYFAVPNDACLTDQPTPLMDVYVTEDTEWNVITVPYGGILKSLDIQTGVKLIINSDVKLSFPVDEEGGGVNIEPGAAIINHGTLTSCSDHWQGVTVWGNETSDLNLSTQGRYASSNTAEISNAKIGIQNTSGAGIFRVRGGDFINNEVAIKLDGSLDQAPIEPTLSWIKNNNFLVDNSMSPALEFKSFIELKKMNIKKSSMTTNKFTVNQTSPHVPNYGIKSELSTISVNRDDFIGVHTAIFSADGFLNANLNEFTDCKYGLFLRQVAVSSIVDINSI